jgi:hypothetical protein
LNFLLELVSRAGTDLEISEDVAELFAAERDTLTRFRHYLEGGIDEFQRMTILNALGKAGSDHRKGLYEQGLSADRRVLASDEVVEFLRCALGWIDHTIRESRRPSGLYSAYNLIQFQSDDRISIERLYDMLEGQVAVLSSGVLSADEAIGVLNALRNSDLYREDQKSYLLYPDRELPTFLEKNRVPPEWLKDNSLVKRLSDEGDSRLLVRDSKGIFHFNGAIQNAGDVNRILRELSHAGYEEVVASDGPQVLNVFERVFNHRSFTGRSGSFFGYEGLGCIYWHMVSKLILSVAGIVDRIDTVRDSDTASELAKHYYELRAGLGQNKTPVEYGAFPTDPYSHTPAERGARQPGMTGQVKEDILARWHELGVSVRDGRLHFEPRLLREDEFISSGTPVFTYLDISGTEVSIPLEPGVLAFTYCQVPVIYHRASRTCISVTTDDGVHEKAGGELDPIASSEIFFRTGRVKRLDVHVQPTL